MTEGMHVSHIVMLQLNLRKLSQAEDLHLMTQQITRSTFGILDTTIGGQVGSSKQ